MALQYALLLRLAADGFAFVREAGSAVAERTVMALTSTSHLEDSAECRAAKVAGYVVKPIRYQEFLATVAAQLGGPLALWGAAIGLVSVASLAAGLGALLAADRLVARFAAARVTP